MPINIDNLGRKTRLPQRYALVVLGVLCVGLLFGIINRAYDLDSRPLHHDESIHATFALDWFQNPNDKFYRYDPVFHGPPLYFLIVMAYDKFGVSVWGARSVVLLLGLMLLFFPLLFWRQLGIYGVLIAVLLVAVSPLLNYYSRFLIHDYLCHIAIVLSLWLISQFFRTANNSHGVSEANGVSAKQHQGRALNQRIEAWTKHLLPHAHPKRQMWIAALAICLGVLAAAKLVAVIHLTFLIGFAALILVASDQRSRYLAPFKDWTLPVIFCGLSAVTFLYLISSFLQNATIFSSDYIAKTFDYWWSQHQEERLKGPTHFHLRSLILHEPILVCLIAGAAWRALPTMPYGQVSRRLLCGLLFLSILIPFEIKNLLAPLAPLLAKFKIFTLFDLFIYSVSFVMGLMYAGHLTRRGKTGLAFLWYWTFANLAAFSFVGEKVPWLTVYIVIPAIILASCYGNRLIYRLQLNQYSMSPSKWAAAMALSVLFLFAGYTAYMVNHVTDGERRDLLSQVHNSTDVFKVMQLVRKYAHTQPDGKAKIYLVGEPAWEFYFYLRVEDNAHYFMDNTQLDNSFDLMIMDSDQFHAKRSRIEELGFIVKEYDLNGWWVPEYTQMNYKLWWQYALFREVRAGQGGRRMHVAINPKHIDSDTGETVH